MASNATTTPSGQQQVKIDARTFCRHLARLYEAWREKKWNDADSLAFLTGTGSEEENSDPGLAYSVQQWLLGWELTDTLFLLCEKTFYVLTSPSKGEKMLFLFHLIVPKLLSCLLSNKRAL